MSEKQVWKNLCLGENMKINWGWVWTKPGGGVGEKSKN